MCCSCYEVFKYRYDSECLDRDMSTQDILRERRGVCRQFVKIFEAMCAEAGVRCKNIKGFAKGDKYIPGEALVFCDFTHCFKLD